MNNINNSKDINISNFLDTSWKAITDYFINTRININNNDDYKVKIKKYLLKYKRVIALILLIILLVIGYYEYTECYGNNENNEYINIDIKEKSNNKIQSGGVFSSQEEANTHYAANAQSKTFAEKAQAGIAQKALDDTVAKAKADTKTKNDAVAAEKTRKAGLSSTERKAEKSKEKTTAKTADKKEKTERKDQIVADSKKAITDKKVAIKAQQKADKTKAVDSANKKFADFKAKGVSGNLKSGLKGVYNVGEAGAQSIRENADWFYGMLYAVAISLVVCIITIPSIAFFIVGIICYFLLKNNMKSIKSF